MPKESVEWEKCGYCKKVQKNRGGNTGYNCRKHTKKVTITKVRLYTEEQLSQAIASAVEAERSRISDEIIKAIGASKLGILKNKTTLEVLKDILAIINPSKE